MTRVPVAATRRNSSSFFVTTFAGNAGYGSVDGPAPATQFLFPDCVAEIAQIVFMSRITIRFAKSVRLAL